MNEETKQALVSLGMDIEQTKARFMGNEAMLLKFLHRFADDKSFAQMRDAIEAGDSEAAFHQAHTLKGVAGNLGLGTIFEMVGPMVEELRAGDLGVAAERMPALEAAYSEAIAVIGTLPA